MTSNMKLLRWLLTLVSGFLFALGWGMVGWISLTAATQTQRHDDAMGYIFFSAVIAGAGALAAHAWIDTHE